MKTTERGKGRKKSRQRENTFKEGRERSREGGRLILDKRRGVWGKKSKGVRERGTARRGARERECVRFERERERLSQSETNPNSRACTDRRVFLQAPLAMGPQLLTTQSTFCCAVI